MKLPQSLHSTRSYGRANSAFSWKPPVPERGFLCCRLKLSRDRSTKGAWFECSRAGAPRKLPFILSSRPAEDWPRRSGSSSIISPTTLFFAIAARGRGNYSRSSTPAARVPTIISNRSRWRWNAPCAARASDADRAALGRLLSKAPSWGKVWVGDVASSGKWPTESARPARSISGRWRRIASACRCPDRPRIATTAAAAWRSGRT
jgi:hypothetical protein